MENVLVNLKSLVFELVFDETKGGVSAISLVSSPAILTNFIKFNEDIPTVKLILADEDKRIVLGPVIIPNIKIFRSGKSLGLDQDAYCYFRENTIRALAEDYLMKAKNNNVTIQHEEKTFSVKMLESWIVEDTVKDKSSLYGFELPKGSWVASFKIEDDTLWKAIKNNELAGFSIEAALGLLPKGEISLSAENEDARIVIDDELSELILDHCRNIGQTKQSMEDDGWELIYEDYDTESKEIPENLEPIFLTLSISSDPKAESFLDRGDYAIRYEYIVAPGKGDAILYRDGKIVTRDFCKRMIENNLIFRREDISQMSFRGENTKTNSNPNGTNTQNYSIFKYRGSFNCRHIWKRLVFIKSNNPNAGTIIPGYRKGKKNEGPDLTEIEKEAMDPNITKVK
jgi:hypothetical protein